MDRSLPADLNDSVARALAEDVGTGDLTAGLVPASARARARVITRESAVLCGTHWVDAVFAQLDPAIRITWHAADGDTLAPDQLLLEAEGRRGTTMDDVPMRPDDDDEVDAPQAASGGFRTLMDDVPHAA